MGKNNIPFPALRLLFFKRIDVSEKKQMTVSQWKFSVKNEQGGNVACFCPDLMTRVKDLSIT